MIKITKWTKKNPNQRNKTKTNKTTKKKTQTNKTSTKHHPHPDLKDKYLFRRESNEQRKKPQKDPSSLHGAHSVHSEESCARQVLVTTILLRAAETIWDLCILSLFLVTNWTLPELNMPWNVLIALWKMSDIGKNKFATALVSSTTTEEGQWGRTTT